MITAHSTPTATSPGVNVSAKTICATPPPLVLTMCPSKNSQAAIAPEHGANQRERDRLNENRDHDRRGPKP